MASDADLIGRSLDGDVDAFVEVVERHEAAVGSYLARRVGRDAAEDLLGEVWVAAFESRRSYNRSYEDERPWLYGVALNRMRRYWRSRPVFAAAAVVAMVVNASAPGGAVVAGKDSSAPASGAATVDESAGRAPLMTLAGSIKTATPPAGDAWLVKATQVHGTKTMQVVYTLYTDGHAIYTGDSVKGVKRAITRNQDQMKAGGYAPLLKAAVAASDRSPADGRTLMLEAAKDPLVGLDPAARKAEWDKQQAAAQVIIKQKGGNAKPKPYSPEAVQRHFDNALWAYSTEALSAGDGNTQVRAGVLSLLSTIDAVSVKGSTTNGRATLTITAGAEVFGGEGGEVLTIDAKTGMLVKSVSTVPGLPQASTTYESSRVTKADL